MPINKTTECVLAIDIGSSAAKIGLVARTGKVLAVNSYQYPTTEPLRGYKEQNPQDWWSAVVQGIQQALHDVPTASVVAVGVTGYISSLTFLDDDGVPLREAIGFQDQRATNEVVEINSAFSRDELADLLGIDLPPGATWPLPKLIWMKKHEPELLERAHFLLQAKDFINFKLTGCAGSDASSNRGLANLVTSCAADRVLAKFNLPDLLPPLAEPQEVLGQVGSAPAKETSLPVGIPVVVGWNDLNASVLGSGLVCSGQAFDVTGTSEHIGVITDRELRADGLICAPFLPGLKLFYGVTSSGGASLQWYRRLVDKPMDEVVAAAMSSENGLLFLPYLEGERSPIWDPYASGVLVGLRSTHDRGDIARAILEGVAFSLRQITECIEKQETLRADTVIASGGASTIEAWNKIKANVLKKSIGTLANPHAGMQGAAILAAVARGLYPNLISAAKAMARSASTVSPSTHGGDRIDRMYGLYNGIYPALRNSLHLLRMETTMVQHSHDATECKEAVIFGAGKIARGFIAHLLTISGYQITFVEKNPDLVHSLRKQGQYTVEIMGAPERNIKISGFRVLQSDNTEDVVQAIGRATVIFVSIGGPNLPQIAPVLAKGLERRNSGVNIILGENYFQPAHWLRQLIREALPSSRHHWFEDQVGIVETMILRSTIEPTAEMKLRDPLSLKAQNAWEIPADKDAFKGRFPSVNGLVPRENFQGGLIRKLFTYNCINAVIAYLGHLKGYTLLSDAANDSEILTVARDAYDESSDALCKHFGFVPQEQKEFAEAAVKKYQNREIVDPIERNTRDPLRKLSRNDRLVGPACLACEYGKRPVALSRGIAAAFMYNNPNDSSSAALQRLVADKGIYGAIAEICGLDPTGELVGLIVEQYKELTSLVGIRASNAVR